MKTGTAGRSPGDSPRRVTSRERNVKTVLARSTNGNLLSLFLFLRVDSLSCLLSSHFLFPLSRLLLSLERERERKVIGLEFIFCPRTQDAFSLSSLPLSLSPAPSYNELVGFLLTNVRAREKFTSASRNRTRVAPRRRASYRRHAAGVATTFFFFFFFLRILRESEIDAPISRTIRSATTTRLFNDETWIELPLLEWYFVQDDNHLLMFFLKNILVQ